MKPYYDHAGITIYHGDCRVVLPQLQRFDLLLTDPPYGIGCKFRSRLEARWVVFFETLGIEWAYEPDGYTLPPTPGCKIQRELRYLPDFLIKSQPKFPKALWVEVKGVSCDEDEEKLARLVFHSKQRGVMVGDVPLPNGHYGPYGDSWSHADRIYKHHTHGSSISDNLPDWWVIFEEGADGPYHFCQCPFCGAFGFEFDGRSARVLCGCKQHEDIANGDKSYNDASPDLMRAYTAARRERFGT